MTKRGKIDFQDQTVDPATADIKSRAIFENPGNKLYPGQPCPYISTVIISTMRSLYRS